MSEPVFRFKRVKSVSPEPPDPLPASTQYTWKDRLGNWKARWGIQRMQHKVTPGLYRVGTPDADSPVLVTANYRMSFDHVRRSLAGRSVWLLVLDTKGINVWCAAGKGTFGTAEVIRQVHASGLEKRVHHRRLILPQLGAPGVSAGEVQSKTGFHVQYGPVRAEDIPAYLDRGEKATPSMRHVRFKVIDRLVLTPIECVHTIQPTLLLFGALFLANLTGWFRFGLLEASLWIAGLVSGCFFVPVLLPWIPSRAFSLKGAWVGLISGAGVMVLFGFNPLDAAFLSSTATPGWLTALGGVFLTTAVSSYTAMNFTGCSTYTSPTGVLKEMQVAVPIQTIALVLGALALMIAARFHGGSSL